MIVQPRTPERLIVQPLCLRGQQPVAPRPALGHTDVVVLPDDLFADQPLEGAPYGAALGVGAEPLENRRLGQGVLAKAGQQVEQPLATGGLFDRTFIAKRAVDAALEFDDELGRDVVEAAHGLEFSPAGVSCRVGLRQGDDDVDGAGQGAAAAG